MLGAMALVLHPVRRRRFLRTALVASLTAPALVRALAQPRSDSRFAAGQPVNLAEFLARLRQEHRLPALAGAAIKDGVLLANAAVGVRKLGEPSAVTVADKFHIGSCTKAMTASLAAMLVEQGKLQWTSSLAQVFPERVAKMKPGYRAVTLELLLTHRSGAPANSSQYGRSDDPVTAQRLAYLDSVISKAPEHEPGTLFAYSNAGYVIAGAMLERVSGQPWEHLIQTRLFRPLGMTSSGFGPPSKPDQADQPWGHVFVQGKFVPRYGDNPRGLGPAGTVHCALRDYLKFGQWHTSGGMRPPGLLGAAAFAKLNEPPPNQEYAMGWGVVNRSWAQGMALTHSGSNTMNYFVVWLAPKIGLSLAVASNCAGDEVPAVLDQVAAELVRQFSGPQ
jgi:CubicO group peptidase (beta-lactamase class C family)